MTARKKMAFDEIGYWSEIKLDIVKDYAAAYSTILSAQKTPALHHIYIDAFSGAGVHLSKNTGQFVPGSPLNALQVNPPFKEYHFIDLDGAKADHLRGLIGDRPNASVHPGDCNKILMDVVFPRVLYKNFRRGMCLLDPYGLHLDWTVIERAGKMGTIDLFLNFPIMDMNRNALWRNPEGVADEDRARMTAFWGDESWRSAAYFKTPTLFGDEDEKTTNADVAEAFRKRLQTVAAFKHVPAPLPMRNGTGAIVYYLFFASQNRTADKIIKEIFKKYQNRGVH